jgi:hypothetical protein
MKSIFSQWIPKRIYLLLTYEIPPSLDDLNQDELRLGGLRRLINTNISSTVTYVNNLKLRKINDKMKYRLQVLPTNPRINYYRLVTK